MAGHYYLPPSPFLGGRQPLDTLKLVPPSVPVNNPPGVNPAWLYANLNAVWQPGPPLPTLPQKTIVSVDNPPSYSTASLAAEISQLWQVSWPAQGPPKQTPPSVPVNNPPGINPAWLYAQLNPVWLPGPPLPTLPPQFVQLAAVVSTVPPYSIASLMAQLNSMWQPSPPLPPIGQKLTPPSVAVNNPPLYSVAALLSQTVQAWQPGPPYVYPLPKQVVSVDSPPFGIPPQISPETYAIIRQAWEPGPPLPQVAPKFTTGIAVSADNPPPYSIVSLSAQLVQMWQPAPPLPTLGELQTPPSGPIPPPPVTVPTSGGVYPGDEPDRAWTRAQIKQLRKRIDEEQAKKAQAQHDLLIAERKLTAEQEAVREEPGRRAERREAAARVQVERKHQQILAAAQSILKMRERITAHEIAEQKPAQLSQTQALAMRRRDDDDVATLLLLH